MRKKRLFKRIFTGTLTLIMILCINGYSAVISDNDGSAFVTKAEFDAMKNSFNEQVTNYEDSITSKIDGAIASYLAGVKVSKTVTGTIINSSWGEVSSFNYPMTNTFRVPSIDMGYIYSANTLLTNGWNHYQFVQTIGGSYTIPSTSKSCIRPLVSGGTEGDSSTYGNIYWNGIATNYQESWSLFKEYNHKKQGTSAAAGAGVHYYGLDYPSKYSYTGLFTDTFKINLGDNNSHTSTSMIDYWKPITKWGGMHNTLETTYTYTNFTGEDSECTFKSATLKVTLGEDAKSKTKKYDHIITYSGEDSWTVSNYEWTNTARINASSTITGGSVLTALDTTMKKKLHCFGAKDVGYDATTYTDTSITSIGMKTFTPTVEDTSGAIFPSIGMLDDIKAKNIKMYSGNQTVTVDSTNITLSNTSLNEGFPLLYAKEDTEITWRPYFEKVITNVDDETATSTDDVIVKFSLGKFSDEDTVAATSQVIKAQVVGGTLGDTVQLKTDTTQTVKFTMPADGFVYIKFWPNNTNYKTMKSIVKLNLEKCKNYYYNSEA